jgi:Acetyl-CoA dehydrogenase C-terminal like/Acyl-CoA dehydrogenase, C-terminal domain
VDPIAKSWPSEFCLKANKLAIQVLGGYGYAREYPVERLHRDTRLNHIHEGTHGIHGIDLLGRKVRIRHGKALRLLIAEIELTCGNFKSRVTAEMDALSRSIQGLNHATKAVLQCDDIDLALANATLYLDAVGHVVIAWMWLWQASTADGALHSAETSDRDLYLGKIAACR